MGLIDLSKLGTANKTDKDNSNKTTTGNRLYQSAGSQLVQSEKVRQTNTDIALLYFTKEFFGFEPFRLSEVTRLIKLGAEKVQRCQSEINNEGDESQFENDSTQYGTRGKRNSPRSIPVRYSNESAEHIDETLKRMVLISDIPSLSLNGYMRTMSGLPTKIERLKRLNFGTGWKQATSQSPNVKRWYAQLDVSAKEKIELLIASRIKEIPEHIWNGSVENGIRWLVNKNKSYSKERMKKILKVNEPYSSTWLAPVDQVQTCQDSRCNNKTIVGALSMITYSKLEGRVRVLCCEHTQAMTREPLAERYKREINFLEQPCSSCQNNIICMTKL